MNIVAHSPHYNFTMEILLNFLVILIPIFFFLQILPRLQSKSGKVFFGLICSFSAVLSMTFPIVSGPDFLWDLRWIALTLSILYGGIISGSITATSIIIFRFIISGSISPALLNVVIVSVVFIAIFMYLRNYYLPAKHFNKFLLSILFSSITFIVTYLGIFIHFSVIGQIEQFYSFDLWLIILMALSYVFSYMLFAYFSEKIIADHEIKERIVEAEKLELISELAASIAHEVRNPLTVAKGFLQLNRHDGFGKKEHIDLVLSELKQAEQVITNYLDFAKPQIYHQESINMSKFLREIVDLLNPYSTFRGITMIHSIEEHLEINGDMARIRQTLVNIIKNAIEATQKSGVVEVNACYQKDYLQIEVIDTGIGISPEQIKKLGQPYYSTKTKGTGLGLMVTFQLVKAMSGEITYNSKVGVGTTVTILLPVSPFKQQG
jgi:two-component system sporulation sensor kinase B